MNPTYALEEKNKRKKEYLTGEIKNKGYDPEDYIDYLMSTKEGKSSTLEDFSLSELQATIIHFQFKCKKKAKEKWRPLVSKLGIEIFGSAEGGSTLPKPHETVGEVAKTEEVEAKDEKEEKKKEDVIQVKEEVVEEKKADEGVVNKDKPIVGEEKPNTNDKEDVKENMEKSNENKNKSGVEKKEEHESKKPIETKKDEPKLIEHKSEELKPTEIKKDEHKPVEEKKEEPKPPEKKKEEDKPIEPKPVESKPNDVMKEEGHPIDLKKEEEKLIEHKNDELKPIELHKEQQNSGESKTEDALKKEEVKDIEDKKDEAKPTKPKKSKAAKAKEKEAQEQEMLINSNQIEDKPKTVDNPKKEIANPLQQDIVIHPTTSTREKKKKLKKEIPPEVKQQEEPTNALVVRDPNINAVALKEKPYKENAVALIEKPHKDKEIALKEKSYKDDTLISYVPAQSQTITTTQEETHKISKRENKTHRTTTTVTKKEQVAIYQVKTHTSVVDLNKSADDLHATGIVKQEKAFKPTIDAEAQKKKSEEMYGAFLLSSEDIPCAKQEKNLFTDIKDIDIKITNPEWVKNGLFSFTYYQYTLCCAQTQTEVTRRLDDFEWLRAKLTQLFPGTFLPPFPPNVYRTKNDSPKKVLYMQRFMNAIARLKLIRSTRIFADFITLSQVDFATMRKTYDKLEKPKTLPEYKKMEGLVKISISKEQDAKAMQIPKDIYTRSLLFDKLFYSIDCLMVQFDEMAKRFSEVSKVLHEIQGTYANCSPIEDTIGNAFGQLSILMGSWEQGYGAQKTFFRDDVKYYFKFMQKELNTFNNLVEELKTSRNSYNYYFAKVNKKEMLSDKESKEVTSLQKFYGYYLYSTLKEYERLNRKHAKRFEEQFAYMSENRDKFLSDYNHFVSLLNYEIEEPEVLNKH